MIKILFVKVLIFIFVNNLTIITQAEHFESYKLSPISLFKNKIDNGDLLISKILDREGIQSKVTHKYYDMIDASIKLFQFVLSDTDPRRRIASHYLSMQTKNKDGLTFENALLAQYLSDFPSMRSRYSKYFDNQSITHLARALKNMEIGEQFLNYEENEGEYRFSFKRTNKLTKGTDGFGVTGCPEAVWQFQLFQKRKYLGRIGFNFHVENNSIIVSLVNIQGAKNVKTELNNFKKKYGIPFNLFLVKKIKHKIINTLKDKNIIFRGGYYFGGENAPHAMYRMTFRIEDISYFEPGQKMILFERHNSVRMSS